MDARRDPRHQDLLAGAQFVARREAQADLGLGTSARSESSKDSHAIDTSGPALPVTLDHHSRDRCAAAFDTACGAPALGSDETVYCASTQTLRAFTPGGALKWRTDLGGSSPGGLGAPALGSDGTIYIAAADCKLHAVDALGKELWAAEFPQQRARACSTGSSATGEDGTVYTIARLLPWQQTLVAVDTTGLVKWTLPFTQPRARSERSRTPAIAKSGIVYVTVGSDLVAVDPRGNALWTFAAASGDLADPSVDAADSVYVGGRDGNLYAVDASGAELWRFTGAVRFDGGVTIGGDGTLYAGARDGTLYVFGH